MAFVVNKICNIGVDFAVAVCLMDAVTGAGPRQAVCCISQDSAKLEEPEKDAHADPTVALLIARRSAHPGNRVVNMPGRREVSGTGD